MSFLTDIKELNRNHLSVFLCSFAATIGAGTLILFHFHRSLFFSLDWFRFTVLAMSLSLPSLLVNSVLWTTIVSDIAGGAQKTEGKHLVGGFIFASLYTSVSYVSGLLIVYAFAARFLAFASWVGISHIVGFGLMLAFDRKAKRDAAKKLVAATSLATAPRS